MVRGGDTYSSVIGWLKILLPVAALMLLSTLFLLPRQSDQGAELPYAGGTEAGDATREQIVAPRYAGTTPKGDRLTLTADSAEPINGSLARVRAHRLDAQLDMTDGSRITLSANEALVDDEDKSADLEGSVHIVSSTGYVIDTERMLTALDRVDAETLTPVSGSGPAGQFTAGKMTITAEGSGGDVQLLFTGGVNLIYDPQDE